MPNAARKFHQPSKSREWRPSAVDRGYDEKWRRLRIAYIKRHPHCAVCGAASALVDHIQPFKGPGDPLRLSWKNIQALCRPCHAIKTHADKAHGLARMYER